MEKLKFYFINGRSSSGKDTQANFIIESNPEAIRISTGDIFRGASAPDGEYGHFYPLIAPYVELVNAGSFVPDREMLAIVGEVIKENISNGKRSFVFTGFPRTSPQLDKLRERLSEMRQSYSVEANFICLAVTEGRSVKMARTRREAAEAAGLAIRPDDAEEVLGKRLRQYHELVGPMLKSLIDDPEYPLVIIRGNQTIDGVRNELRIKTERES